MRYGQLKAFHHVAMLGGFSRAADALNLTQPAVSEHVRKLEQAHDVLLFRRESRRVFLTDAGAELLQRTKQLFDVEAEIESFLSKARSTVTGELRIVADSAVHVTRFLGPFSQKHPKVKVQLLAGNTDGILDALRAYDADIGVVGDRSPGRDMIAVDLGSTDIVAFVARDFTGVGNSITLKQLSQVPLVLRETGSKTRQKLEEAAAISGVTLKPTIVAQGREAVRELVASGAGVGFVSQAEFLPDDRVRMVPIKQVELSMAESLIYLKQRRDVKVIRSFVDLVETLL